MHLAVGIATLDDLGRMLSDLSRLYDDLVSALKYIGAATGVIFDFIAFTVSGTVKLFAGESKITDESVARTTDIAGILMGVIAGAFAGPSVILYSWVRKCIPDNASEVRERIRKLHVGRVFCGVTTIVATMLGLLMLAYQEPAKGNTQNSFGNYILAFCTITLCVMGLYFLYSCIVDARIYLAKRDFAEGAPRLPEEEEAPPQVPDEQNSGPSC